VAILGFLKLTFLSLPEACLLSDFELSLLFVAGFAGRFFTRAALSKLALRSAASFVACVETDT
jgi:hypothetical protein